MTQDRIAEVNMNLDFAKHNLDSLIALFGYKKNGMIYDNKARALSMANCIIDIMVEVKRDLANDDGKGV